MNIDSALERLKSGNDNFMNNKLSNLNQDSARRNDVVSGQNPFAVILTCSDSRVVPELIFDTGIGELFIIRVAGNIANASSIASIEYAVANLSVPLVIVLGHQNCGAVTSALADGDYGENLNHLLGHIKPAITEAKTKVVDAVSTLHVKLTSEKLVSGSKTITDAIENGTTKILPSFYSLDTGKVYFDI